MLDDRVVALAIEEWRDAADGFVASLGCVLGELRGALGGCRSHMHYVVDPAPVLVCRYLGNAHVFLVVEEYALSGASCYPEPMHTCLDVVFHHLAEGGFVQSAVLAHWRDDCGQYAFKVCHIESSILLR